MTRSNTQTRLSFEEQRVDNLRHARDINSYWRIRGVEAHARVVMRSIRLDLEDGKQKIVRSAEIMSNLPPMMNRALALSI